MKQRDYQPTQALIYQVPEPAQPQQNVAQTAESYRAPQLHVIGKATDLMKAGSIGYWYETYYGWIVGLWW